MVVSTDLDDLDPTPGRVYSEMNHHANWVLVQPSVTVVMVAPATRAALPRRPPVRLPVAAPVPVSVVVRAVVPSAEPSIIDCERFCCGF